MKIGLKFSMKSYLKFSSKKVGWAKGGWGGGVDPTEKDGSSPWPGAGELLPTRKKLFPVGTLPAPLSPDPPPSFPPSAIRSGGTEPY